MADYQLTNGDSVIRTSDNATIPGDPDNRDRAQYDVWLAAGGVPDPYVAPAIEPSFLARELLAELTASDFSAIQTAIASSSALGLLWAALLAQGDAPMVFTNVRVQAGWQALSAALGDERMAEIAAALHITSS